MENNSINNNKFTHDNDITFVEQESLPTNNKKTSVSIIVAIYNMEKYLNKCLNSLINQTLKNIEIILINDGSTDKSSEIIEEYKSKDLRIKVINQNNQGPGEARNRGIKIANGEYILFVDPDDWIELDACEVLYDKAKEINADVVLTGDTLYLEETGTLEKGYRDFSNYKTQHEIREKDFFKTFTAGCERLYKTEFLKKHKLYFNPHDLWEDSSFGCLIAILAKRIGFTKNLYYYRIRKDPTTGEIDYKVFDWVKDFEYFSNYIDKYKIKSKKVTCSYIWYLSQFFNYYNNLSLNNKKIFYSKLISILPLLKLNTLDILFSKAIPLERKQEIILFLDYLKTKNFMPKLNRLFLFGVIKLGRIRSTNDT